MFQSISIISLYYNLIVSVFRNTRNRAWYFHLFQILFQFCFYAARARNLPWSLMNRLNRTESAVFELWFLFFKESLFFFFLFKLLIDKLFYLHISISVFISLLGRWMDELEVLHPFQQYFSHIRTLWKGEHEMPCGNETLFRLGKNVASSVIWTQEPVIRSRER